MSGGMSEREASDVIRAAAVRQAPGQPAWLFALGRGEAVWIPDDGDSGMDWLDWLTGIVPPPWGEVFWKGVEWRQRGPDDAAAERGRIGCVFATGGLVMNLDMDENVWLPARMHRRPEAAEAIERWARFFGCWPLPPERAPAVKERDKRRILWTRAWAGNPAALVLEQPLRDTLPEDRALLLEAVRLARAGGCAVIWLDRHLKAETQAALEPLIRAAPEAQ
jgi:ABC-type lipoprotein export system ATPase subunit